MASAKSSRAGSKASARSQPCPPVDAVDAAAGNGSASDVDARDTVGSAPDENGRATIVVARDTPFPAFYPRESAVSDIRVSALSDGEMESDNDADSARRDGHDSARSSVASAACTGGDYGELSTIFEHPMSNPAPARAKVAGLASNLSAPRAGIAAAAGAKRGRAEEGEYDSAPAAPAPPPPASLLPSRLRGGVAFSSTSTSLAPCDAHLRGVSPAPALPPGRMAVRTAGRSSDVSRSGAASRALESLTTGVAAASSATTDAIASAFLPPEPVTFAAPASSTALRSDSQSDTGVPPSTGRAKRAGTRSRAASTADAAAAAPPPAPAAAPAPQRIVTSAVPPPRRAPSPASAMSRIAQGAAAVSADVEEQSDLDLSVALAESAALEASVVQQLQKLTKRHAYYIQRMAERAAVVTRRWEQRVVQMQSSHEGERAATEERAAAAVRAAELREAAARDEAHRKDAEIAALQRAVAAARTECAGLQEQVRTFERRVQAASRRAVDAEDEARALQATVRDLEAELQKSRDHARRLAGTFFDDSANDAAVAPTAGAPEAPPPPPPCKRIKSRAASEPREALGAVSHNVPASAAAAAASSSATSSRAASKQHQQQLQQQKRTQPNGADVGILFTGFRSADRLRLTQLATALGATVVTAADGATLPAAVTHVVVGSHTSKATLGMLGATASSKGSVWVVPAAFITASAEQGEWVDPASVDGEFALSGVWQKRCPVVAAADDGRLNVGDQEVLQVLMANGFQVAPSGVPLQDLLSRLRPLFLDQ